MLERSVIVASGPLRLGRGAVAAAVGALFVMVLCVTAGRVHASSAPDFAAYIASLWPKAEARQVSRATFDAAFKGYALEMTRAE